MLYPKCLENIVLVKVFRNVSLERIESYICALRKEKKRNTQENWHPAVSAH